MNNVTRPFGSLNERVVPEVRLGIVEKGRNLLRELGRLCGMETITQPIVHCPDYLEIDDTRRIEISDTSDL